MADQVALSQFHARSELPDWRVLLGGVEASFVTASFDATTSFVQDIASAAEAAGLRRPDVDVRYPDRVHVTLMAGPSGLTMADVGLASTISSLASNAGMTTEPRSALRVEVAIDAMDIDAVRPFWQAVAMSRSRPRLPVSR